MPATAAIVTTTSPGRVPLDFSGAQSQPHHSGFTSSTIRPVAAVTLRTPLEITFASLWTAFVHRANRRNRVLILL